MNNSFDEVLNVIQSNNTFLLIAHKKPDGDAIGSAIALGKGLKALNKKVDYYIDPNMENKIKIFDEIECFNQNLQSNYDLVIFLDCSTKDYAYFPSSGLEETLTLVIDHHRSNTGFCDMNYVIESAATGELIFDILKALQVTIDSEIADALYTSISTDTGSFQFSNVTTNTHRVLSELYKIKKSYAVLAKKLHEEKTLEQIKILGHAINSLQLLCDGQIAWINIAYEDIIANGGGTNIGDEVSNLGVNIPSVKLSATLKELEKGVFKVSLRSKSPHDIDVSTFAKSRGGGGHMRAAGFTFTGDPMQLQKELIEFLQ